MSDGSSMQSSARLMHESGKPVAQMPLNHEGTMGNSVAQDRADRDGTRSVVPARPKMILKG